VSNWRTHTRSRRTRWAQRVVYAAAAVSLLLSAVGPQAVHAACSGNAIVCENQNPGTPQSTWDISGSGDPSIQGFAIDVSYNKGDTVNFKINTPASAYTLVLYRLGYYQGNGARQIATVTPSVTLPQSQPACLTDAATGLIDCGNWAVSASWTIPSTAVSGIYVAKLTRSDTGGSSHIVFVVRDDASTSSLLFQTDDTTWQAYNQYGGNSVYMGTGPGGGSQAGRAFKVSYNRPFSTRGQGTGYGPSNFVFYAEYPMVRFLESNGYDVSYFSGLDTDRRGALIKNHKTFLSVGHDEYWSGGARANVEAARDAGVNLGFFSGNEMYWKVRWEPSIDGTNTANRTLVTYKESLANGTIDPRDPPTWTGLWRDPRFSPPADGGRPENAVSGTIFMVNRGSAAITVPATYSKLRFWRNTAVSSLTSGSLTLGAQTLGYEWDEDLDNPTVANGGPAARPAGLIDMSATTVSNVDLLQDYGSTTGAATATHHLTLYRAPSGALVFGAGTVQWTWGLDVHHDTDADTGAASPDLNMEQATVNILADMGAQPTSLQAGLVAAAASSDKVAPTSSISSPTNGASIGVNTTATISGTASDTGGGVVGGVEVSTDGGQSWHPATGTTSWTYSWKPTSGGPFTLRSRAADDSGNLEAPAPGVSVSVTGDTTPPTISSVNTASIASSSVSVTWTTSEPATSQIQYGTTTAYGSSTTVDAALVTNHTETVSGLNASTTYDFRVVSKDAVGNQATSGNFVFTTSAAGTTSFVGDQATEPNQDSNAAGLAEAFQYSATSGGVANKIYVYVDGANSAITITVGLYANNATNNPGSLLAQGIISSPTGGAWNFATIPATSITSGTKYWIAILSPSGKGAMFFRDVPSGALAQNSSQSNLTALPATWSTGLSWSNAPMSAYVAGSSSDAVPPTVSITSPAAGATLTGTVPITATASDNVGVANVQFFLDSVALGPALVTAPYSFNLDTSSIANGTHTLGAQAKDTSGNVTSAASVSVTISNPPAIANVATTNLTPVAVTITWSTNVAATSQVEYGTTTSYGSASPLDSSLVTSHSQTLSGLTPATSYDFQVVSKDSAGDQATSGNFTFTTPAFTVTSPQATANSTSSATVTWATNEPSTSQVLYGPTSSYGSSTALDAGLVSNHSQTISGLSSGTTYHYQIVSIDSSGNQATSADLTFTTQLFSISSVQVSGITGTGATITWTTNAPGDSQVDYGTTSSYGTSTTVNPALVTSHSVSLSGLTAGTTYHYRADSHDATGTLVTSKDASFTTASAVIVGDAKVETNVDNNSAGVAEAFQYTAASSGSVSRLFVYVDGGSTATSVVVGLYTNTSSNNPGTLLAQATIASPTKGAWNSATIPAATIASGTKYWIAVLGPSGAGTFQFRDVPSGGLTQNSSQSNLAVLPATWSPGPKWANSPMSAYATAGP
jgi:Bacterial Ig domain/Purple acid Phosphatase, N-terminal domain